ncbi:hypothetical protein QOZ80_1BG0083770 [Eleusine coracana subsp. coracana]|nr:hypothetical protein QOZ80_1BG0083770 [Eleusine coracana subsp. coracana]
MRLKRSHGGGDYGDQVVLGAVGLGNFARLRLPEPPDDLEVDAAYDHASGRITVSVGGEGFSASAVDLAAALALPPGAVGPAAGVGTDFLSSPEAIAAVTRFVRELLIPGDGEDGGTASEDVAAALRLVEEGKAYEVDWARLIWAVLKGEVLAGTPRRYAPFLFRLLEYQRPELFAEVDEMLPLRKRWKGRTLQPSHCADEKLGISEQCEVEDKEEISFDDTLSQDIGDLEEMPIFGEGRQREVTLAVPVDCRGTFMEQEEILGVDQGHAELRSQRCSFSDANLLDSDTECGGGGIAREDVYNQTFACNSSFGWQLGAMDEQDDSSGPLQLISGTKSQPASNLQRTIEIDDDDDDDLGIGVGSAVVRNVPLEISPYPVQEHGQTLQSFNGCIQQILACVLCMQEGYSDKEKDCRQLEAEVHCLKKMVMKKEHIIEATRCDILKDLRANETKMDKFEKAREVMFRTFQHCKKLLQKSSAEFQEYNNMMQCGKGVDSYLGVSA